MLMVVARSHHRRLLAVVTMAVAAAAPGAVRARQAADIPVVRLEAVRDAQTNQPRSLPVTRLDDGQQSTDLDATRAVSLTFATPLSVRDVLLLLFRGTPFSVVFDPGIKGTFIGELSNLTMRQALEAVLVPSGLDYALKGRVVRVFPRRPETRLFTVSHLDMKRAWQRRVRSVSGDAAIPAAELSASVQTDFFGQLADGVRMLLSPSGRVHVDSNAGVVQVTDFADRLDQVGLYLETVTLRASRQVRLDARVLEVTLSSPAGIDWTAVGTRAGVTPGTGAGIRVADFNALLQAIGAFGNVHVMASPRFVAMNNEPAYMRVGSETAAFMPQDGQPARIRTTAGLTLSITSQVGADGIVHMSISPTWTGAADEALAPAPIVEMDTTVRVREGETVVISGLLRDTAGATDQKTNRAELVILLTPTIVTAGSPQAGAQ